ncbi:hypothetical protein HC891_25110, partial [Candidatus Gracilibacteria bacterium]|nr:hypothetical protein [Candidatus Gracilibacteria bacterium]
AAPQPFAADRGTLAGGSETSSWNSAASLRRAPHRRAGPGRVAALVSPGRRLGPAHIRGDAPLADGLLSVDGVSDDRAAQLLFTPATNADALAAALPPAIDGILGHPFAIDIARTSGSSLTFTLSLAYNPDQLVQLGLDRTQLRILYFDPLTQFWQIVPTDAVSPAPPGDFVPTPLPSLTAAPSASTTLAPTTTVTASVTPIGTSTAITTKTLSIQRVGAPATDGDAGWFWVASQPLSRDGIYALAWAPLDKVAKKPFVLGGSGGAAATTNQRQPLPEPGVR